MRKQEEAEKEDDPEVATGTKEEVMLAITATKKVTLLEIAQVHQGEESREEKHAALFVTSQATRRLIVQKEEAVEVETEKEKKATPEAQKEDQDQAEEATNNQAPEA